MIKNKAIMFVLGVIFLSASIVTAFAYLITSNTIHIYVEPQAILTLSANATTIIAGVECVEFTAEISDGSPGLTVTFYQDGTPIGTAITDISGTATYVTGILTEDHDYYATVEHP